MPWLDLEEGILEEFSERSAFTVLSEKLLRFQDRQREKQRVYSLRSYEKHRARYLAQRRAWREAKHATRDPCLWCGGPTPIGRIGQIPIYCTPKCLMRAGNRKTKARVKADRRKRRIAIIATRPPCLLCGAVNLQPSIRAKYCSRTCCRIAARAMAKARWCAAGGRPRGAPGEWERRDKERRRLAREQALESLPPCPVCKGKVSWHKNTFRVPKYCSRSCTQKASYRRRRKRATQKKAA